MKHKVFTSIVALLLIITTNGQRQNNVFAEFAGNTAFASLNYENLKIKVSPNGEAGKAFRAGIGFSPRIDSIGGITVESGSSLSLLLGYSTFFNYSHTGLSTEFIEIGGNLVYFDKRHIINKIWDYKEKDRVCISLNLGYRHQSLDKNHLFWKLYYCPLIFRSGLKHWLGVSLGYSF